MNGLTRLKETLAGYLTGQPGLAHADILFAWPSRRRLPLKSPAIAVGVDGVELSPAGLEGWRDFSGGSGLYGSSALITLRFDLFIPAPSPEAADARALHELYEALCAALACHAPGFGLTRIWCDPPGWDDAASALRLTARASLRAALTIQEPSSDDAGFTDFTVRSELIV